MRKILKPIAVCGLALWLAAMPAAADQLTLFATGNTRGLASCYHYDFDLPYALASSFLKQSGERLGLRGFEVDRNEIAFFAEGNYLWGKGFGIHQLTTWLQHPPQPLRRRQVTLLLSNDGLIVEGATRQALMPELLSALQRTPNLREWFHVQDAELEEYADGVLRLRLAESASQLPSRPQDWELLLGFELSFGGDGASVPLTVIGQPEGEGSRRSELIRQLRAPGDLLVDAGNLLEGLSSVNTDQLSLQRVNSLKMAQAMHYFAINVGTNELLGGLDNLRQEAQRYRLPLISASLRRQGDYLFEPYKLVRTHQFRLAVIGIAPIAELEDLRNNGILPADVELLPPEKALNEALQRLHQREQVEYVVILAPLPAAELQRLLQNQRGVHLAIADFDSPLQHSRESLHIKRSQQTRALTVHANPYAVSLLEVSSEGDDLSLKAEQLPVHFRLPPDARFLPDIMAIRQQAYRDALAPLLPDLGPAIAARPDLAAIYLQSPATRKALARLRGVAYDPLETRDDLSPAEILQLLPPYLTAELLANLEMNGLTQAFGAEAMAMRLDDAMELAIPGPLSRLLLYERTRSSDTLERYYLNGEQLKKLLHAGLPGLVFAGATADGDLIGGRPIGDKTSVYRVLLTSSLAHHSQIRPLLAGSRSESRLENPFEPQAPAGPRFFRDMVLALFTALRPDPLERIVSLLAPTAQQRQLLLTLRADKLQLNLSDYSAFNNASYTQVRETRVIAPNSYTLGGSARLSALLDNQAFGLSGTVNAQYESQSVLDPALADRSTEKQDDLTFTGNLQLNFLDFSLLGLQFRLTPYLESVYDTEFTPTLNQTTQVPNPRQAEWRNVLGLTIPAVGYLQSFKTGLALRKDFNVPNDLELGLDLKLRYVQPLADNLSWNNDFDFRYFLPDPQDTPASLGLIAHLISGLDFNLTENLALKLFADSYLFQGKLPASPVGLSVIFGVGLGFDRGWKPFYEPLWHF